MKLFGREPAAWVGLIGASVALLVVFDIVSWTNEQTGLIMAAVTAAFGVLTAYLTRDTMLGVLVGFTEAVIALIIGFGFEIRPDATAAIVAFVTIAVQFFQRTQTGPAVTPSFSSGP